MNVGVSILRPVSLRAAFLVAGCLCAAVGLAGAANARTAAAQGQKMTIYSAATQEQFLNHKDDRSRGNGNNPFGNFKDATSATTEGQTGPFPGDRAVFTFKLFKDAALKTQIGSATFVCGYGFQKNAFCNAAYVLPRGTLSGAGAFNFSASQFALAITGGTGSYRSWTGDMTAVPSAKRAQRLVFRLSNRRSQ